jgi:hypothetical protein
LVEAGLRAIVTVVPTCYPQRTLCRQEHFIDLCRLVGHEPPAEYDSTGKKFTFEAGADKQKGRQGWADVWKKGYFAWEYKGKHADLDEEILARLLALNLERAGAVTA